MAKHKASIRDNLLFFVNYVTNEKLTQNFVAKLVWTKCKQK